MITLNTFINRFRDFAENHYFLKSFSFGAPEDLDLGKVDQYPIMHVVYTGATYEDTTKSVDFEVYIFDLPTYYDSKTERQKEVVSDAEQVAEDIIADISNGFNIFIDEENYEVTNAVITPLQQEGSNMLAGVLLDLTIEIPYDRSACDAPINGVTPEGTEITYARRGVLRVLTQDGTVDVLSVRTIKVTNGTLTDEGNGIVSIDTGGVDSLGQLTDVTITDPLDHDALIYDEVTAQWINGAPRALDIAVHNNSGAAIAKGVLCKAVGVHGDKVTVGLFALGVDSPKYLLGVTYAQIANGADGHVRTYGEVRQLNTNAYTPGTILYASPTPGAFVTTAPFPEIPVAIVTRQQINTGRIFVRTWVPGGGGAGTTTNPTTAVLTNAAYTAPAYAGKSNYLLIPPLNLWTVNQGSLTVAVNTAGAQNLLTFTGNLTGRPITGNITVGYTGLGTGTLKVQVLDKVGALFVTVAEINTKYSFGAQVAKLSFTYNTTNASAQFAFAITPSPTMVGSAYLNTVSINI